MANHGHQNALVNGNQHVADYEVMHPNELLMQDVPAGFHLVLVPDSVLPRQHGYTPSPFRNQKPSKQTVTDVVLHRSYLSPMRLVDNTLRLAHSWPALLLAVRLKENANRRAAVDRERSLRRTRRAIE
jgi:hypothetical protein